MNHPRWAKALKTCADPRRARHYLDLLAATDVGPRLDNLPDMQIATLVALFSGSQAGSELLVANPGLLDEALNPERLLQPRHAPGLRQEMSAWLPPLLQAREFSSLLTRLRQFKQRELLRIAARDLARLSHAAEITRELSDVAEVCLGVVWQSCVQQAGERFGRPHHQDAAGRWQPTESCVMGMGKLGGQELNYSSDVDLLIVYTEEGQVCRETPRAVTKATPGAMASHAFFNRAAKNFIEEVTRLAPEGMLYRIDMRLRPEGATGPLTRSIAGYENYYSQWGQTWERMMLIKARCVAGDASLAHEFLEMIQPFRYPRSLNEHVLREIAAMKARIEREVLKPGEIERNVKLGRGGIREIEFVAQTLQILHAGKQPFLQDPQTLPALAKLVTYHRLHANEAASLVKAYPFLRDVEHRLQMENQFQTHTIPEDRKSRERLSRLMGFSTLKRFESTLSAHQGRVRAVYDRLLKTDTPAVVRDALPPAFDGEEGTWQATLAAHTFRDPAKAFRLFKEFAEGPGFVHVSPRTVELARQLIPRFLALCPHGDATVASPKSRVALLTGPGGDAQPAAPRAVLSDPDRVLMRLDSFVIAYGARATLFDIWAHRPAGFELLLWLFDRSEFLAELAIRTPDLIEELVQTGQLRRRKTADDILNELLHGANDADQHRWLRKYQQAEQMRVGLRHILDYADTEQTFTEISALADACLRYALAVVRRKRKLKSLPLVVIGLGKLGGGELSYGSDLDILFVADDKVKQLPKLQPLAAEVMDLLSRRTELGVAFVTDARLRPDGEKGLLVNTLGAYEDYYRQRAMLWEIQALARTRIVAGDAKLGDQFQKLASRLTDFSGVGRTPILAASGPTHDRRTRRTPEPITALPVCVTPDWQQKIRAMRARIEKERTAAGQEDLAMKTAPGGLMDAEFLAQMLCLRHGWHEPNTLRALERAREAAVIPRPDADRLIRNYRELRRLEGILRRWSYEGETVLPQDPEAFHRVAVRCGFRSAEDFRSALAGWRRTIREVYDAGFES